MVFRKRRIILWSITAVLLATAGALYLAQRRIAETPTDDPWFADVSDVPALSEPGPSDWLAVHDEPGQSFAEYLDDDPRLPDQRRGVIYLQPIGPTPDLVAFADGLAIFTGLNVRVLDTWQPTTVTARTGADGNTQWLTADLLAELQQRLPDDAYCILGLTTTDLWTGAGSNFVFGQASLSRRVGVQSFARYGDPDTPEFGQRAFKVIAHETGHMFGIRHCTAFACLMNGSNNRPEMDRKPFVLCPVCLRKLHAAVGFDVEQRYGRLATFHRSIGLDASADWIEQRVSRLAP